MNKLIIKSFYQFNLKLADLYYQNISQYKWDYNKTKEEQINVPIKSQKECQLNPDEYLFFSCFANSLFCNCLDNFVGGYSNREPKIYKAPKLIFDNLLYFLKIKKKYKLDDRKISDILVIYDEIYTNKIKSIEKENNEINLDKNKNNIIDTSIQLAFYEEEEKRNKEIININHKTFTFFEFYKYYISSPDTALYFYNISFKCVYYSCIIVNIFSFKLTPVTQMNMSMNKKLGLMFIQNIIKAFKSHMRMIRAIMEALRRGMCQKNIYSLIPSYFRSELNIS